MSESGNSNTRHLLWNKAPSQSRCEHISGPLLDWIESVREDEFQDIRKRLSELWSRLPLELCAEYYARLKSRTESDVHSAYSEIWYRESLIDGGFGCEPPIACPIQSNSKPDWNLSAHGGVFAIVECCLILDTTPDRVERTWFAEASRILVGTGKRIWIYELTEGKQQPSARKLAQFIQSLNDDIHSTHRYEDNDSGWSMEFKLLPPIENPDASPRTLVAGRNHDFKFSAGTDRLSRVLDEKSRQHTANLPVVICLGWNDLANRPELSEVIKVLRINKAQYIRRQVAGLFWTQELYLWNPLVAQPVLLHWGGDSAKKLLASWTGDSRDVLLDD